METTPSHTPPPKKPLMWPVAVNLAALVVAVVALGASSDSILLIIVALTLINLLAAMLTGMFRRLNWVAAFLLSALLVPLIGFGLCAMYIQLNGGLHGGN